MEQSALLFTASPWFTVLCAVTGGAYAWLLYHPLPIWSRTVNYLLAGARGLLVFLICFLLLSPLVKTVRTTVEKAKVVLAIDNSGSLADAGGSGLTGELVQLSGELETEGYDLSLYTFDGPSPNLDSVRFNHPVTNLSGLLSSIRSSFEGQNLTDVILVSDGILNQGASPVFQTFPFRIHTVGVGDTIPKRDISVKRINANRVAFLDNKFPIQADIVANGMAGQRTTVSLKQGSRTLETRQVTINGDHHFETVTFTTSSSKKGIQHYTVEIGGAGQERVLQNNRREVYIDIIDGREKILILGLTPHPDLKALRSILAQHQHYEFDLHVLTSGPLPEEVYTTPYDLIILHQLPDIYGMGNETISRLTAKGTAAFYILGNQSSVAAFNPLNRNVALTTVSNQFDKATGRFNVSFQSLNLQEEKLRILEKLPPLSVPYGDYRLATGTETVLYQKLGNLNTTRPLLTLNTAGDRKTGTLLGEGLWRWRQEEFSLTEKTETVDDLFAKIIQLLSIKEDKRKFRVYPTAPEFNTGEPVMFRTEVYNDIYEKIFGQEINIRITAESSGKTNTHTYQNTAESSRFELSGLEEGVYHYTATTVLKGNTESVSGQLVVRNTDLESLQSTADFGMLREISSKTGGRFLYRNHLSSLTDSLRNNRAPDRLDSTDELVELIYLKWLFFLLVALAVLEWGTRKYLGGY